MSTALHVIAAQGAGRLATVAHPRGDDWPAELLGGLADVGVSVLVSALTTAEREALGHADPAAAAAEVGMEVMTFPAADEEVPRDEGTKVVLLAGRLAANVRAGRFVAVQCFGGMGRPTLLACTTLVLLGIRPGDALRRVTDDTAASITRDWLHRARVSPPYAESERPAS